MSTVQNPAMTHWRTLRPPVSSAAADTPLTDYKPSDVTNAVFDKMASVHPATAILIRAFGQGSNDGTVLLRLSGWMHPRLNKQVAATINAGPGQRLLQGTVILGNKPWTGTPIGDGKWDNGTWREVDTWPLPLTAVTDSAVNLGYPIDAVRDADLADKETCLLLPTLGYTHILAEISGHAAGATTLGLLYRPIRYGEVNMTF